MHSVKFSVGTVNARRIIKLILALIGAAVLVFFLIRFVPLSQTDGEVEFLRLVGPDSPIEESYVPALVEVEGVPVSEGCGEDLLLFLQAARNAGFEPVLLEGYVDRKQQQENYERELQQLREQGLSQKAAKELLLAPGANEHQLGLTVDIVDAEKPYKDSNFASSDIFKWLEEHCWEYGFVIRYPEGKEELTGREFIPWHYRYVGVESAKLMKELQLCLEEYYTWFYSDEVIVIE